MSGDKGFEQALAELEGVVRLLEGGDLPLDEALEQFERGVALARTCHEHLDAAEQRVAALKAGRAGVEEEPLPEPGG